MRPEPEMIPVLIDAAEALKGSQRRLFMAKPVKAMGRGGQVWALEHLGWHRDTIRKGMHELDSGMTCVDALSAAAAGPPWTGWRAGGSSTESAYPRSGSRR